MQPKIHKSSFTKMHATFSSDIKERIVHLLSTYFATPQKTPSVILFMPALVDDLCRPGWICNLLGPKEKNLAADRLQQIAPALDFDHGPSAIAHFATQATEIVLQLVPNEHLRGFSLEKDPQKRLSYVKELVAKAYKNSKDSELTVNQVARRLHSAQKKFEQQLVSLPLAEGDPVREILGLPKHHSLRMPKTDVRSIMLNGKNILSILKEAAPFAENTMRELLGDELFAVCKPIAYGNADKSLLVIKVPSSSHAYDMQFKKQAILARLKAAKAFENVRNLRFVV